MANIPNFIVMLHHYKRQDDRQRIEIRIHFNRISKYYKTELLIHPEHFNPSGQIKTKKGKKDSYIEDSWILSSYHKFQEYNRVIASEIERLNAAWKELQKEKKTISASSILNKLNEVDSNASVLQFVNLEIRQKMQKSKLSAGP
ncbi:MAG TPA: hypothetical protein VGE24_06505, partial [Emticicia sp.]